MVIYYRNGSQSFAANVLNQYSAIDGTRQPTYDDSGNMVNNGLNKTFSYDSENRLIYRCKKLNHDVRDSSRRSAKP